MRAGKSGNRKRSMTTRTVGLVALMMVLGAGACGVLQETQEHSAVGATRSDPATTQDCDRAINVASFMPNFVAPDQARADAQAKLAELDLLMRHTSDEELRSNLHDVRDTVRMVAAGEVTLDQDNTGEWASIQSEHYEEVTTTCSRVQQASQPQ